ncbi:lactate racemase domain-containing protein [Maioricimonas sp. JC845]|uniref:lactate racemase domain-containing protein n=1 Tax=Maioricimonas sp. JC845 TaxID=3232138 RepID=UPI00345A5FCE
MTDVTFQLRYGSDLTYECSLESDRVVARHLPPPALIDLPARIAEALAAPLEFPSLHQAIVPGDDVTIVLERDTPQAGPLLAAVWDEIASRDVSPDRLTVLQPASYRAQAPLDPRSALPEGVREHVTWKVHDPATEGECAYLASTAAGERIYLAREAVDADFVLTVGELAFDTLLGYRGTSSSLYPGLSTVEALRRSHGQGHDELSPDDQRPLRELTDEIHWLLGGQFSLQVIAADGQNVSAVVAGQADAVLRRGKKLLAETWQFEVSSRPELVLVAVDADAGGHHWSHVAAALDAARHIVARDGRIVLLSELADEATDGILMVRDARTPRDALQPLRQAAPADLIAATQLARTIDWANVYLLSHLDDDLVEDLFMIPLADEQEVDRLLEGDEPCAVIGGGQHTLTRLKDR